MSTYTEFLETKRQQHQDVGIDVPLDELNPNLFDWQALITQWSLRKVRAALFCDTGLGKTIMQLSWADEIHRRTDHDVLILAPLAVARQTEAEAIDRAVMSPVRVCRDQSEVYGGITITNYERLHLFDASHFGAVVLDESSILKSFTGSTKRELIRLFKSIPYRLCATATPSPNDLMELGNHSEFLGIMPSNEMLSRWFINNTMAAGDYRLKGHAEADFWRWVASWAVAIGHPNDLGYVDDRFNLPELKFHTHMVDADVAPPEGMLCHVNGQKGVCPICSNLNCSERCIFHDHDSRGI